MSDHTDLIHAGLDAIAETTTGPHALLDAVRTITNLHICYCQVPPDPRFHTAPSCGQWEHRCIECSGPHGADSTDWPCPTITALADVWPEATSTPKES